MTAVEYMIEQLKLIGLLEIPKGSNAVTSIINEAKELEKQQGYSKEDMRAAWIHGDIRSPQEFKHLNNFNVWLENFKKK